MNEKDSAVLIFIAIGITIIAVWIGGSLIRRRFKRKAIMKAEDSQQADQYNLDATYYKIVEAFTTQVGVKPIPVPYLEATKMAGFWIGPEAEDVIFIVAGQPQGSRMVEIQFTSLATDIAAYDILKANLPGFAIGTHYVCREFDNPATSASLDLNGA